jgi:predicted type IV restriction endonuclease
MADKEGIQMAKANDGLGAIREARRLIAEVQRLDGNEAETRRRVERIFESVMGYDVFKHLSREHAVHGVGDTEHMDFAIKVGAKDIAMVVELKRVDIDLSRSHLKQASRYAIDLGCEWVLLTNGRQWDLYHVEFGQPPDTRLMTSWNLLEDELADVAASFELISFRSIKKNKVRSLWEKKSVLTPECLLNQILSEDSIRRYKNGIRKEAGVSVHPEDIVAAIRKLLNDNAASLMDQLKISLPARKARKGKAIKTHIDSEPTGTPTLHAIHGKEAGEPSKEM